MAHHAVPTTASPRIAPAPEQPGTPAEPIGRDKFAGATENAFKIVREAPVSTFSIDVDTASYAFVRALAEPQRAAAAGGGAHRGDGQLFPLRLSRRRDDRERAVPHRPSRSFRRPWNPRARRSCTSASRAMRCSAATRPARQSRVPDRHVGLDGRAEPAAAGQAVARDAGRAARSRRTASRSSPMRAAPGTVLEPTPGCRQGRRSSRAIDRLEAGGSTAGGEGIRQAYELAERNFDPERRQPRDPGDRRRLQCRHHRSETSSKGFVERERGKRHLPVRARLRHGQLQRRADADAGAERQRHRRLHRHDRTRRARCWSTRRPRRSSRSPRT